MLYYSRTGSIGRHATHRVGKGEPVRDWMQPWTRFDMHRVLFLVRVVVWIGAGFFAFGSHEDGWVWLGAALALGGGAIAVRVWDYSTWNRAAIGMDVVAITLAVRLSGGVSGDTWVLYGGEALALTTYGSLRWTAIGSAVMIGAFAVGAWPRTASAAFAFEAAVLAVFILSAGMLGRGFVLQQQHVREDRRRLMQLDNLRVIQENLLREAPLEVLLQNLLRQGLQLVGLDYGYIGVPVGHGQMQMVTQLGFPERGSNRAWDIATSEPTATAVRVGDLVVHNAVAAADLDEPHMEDFGSVAVAPLYDGRALLGVLAVGSPEPDMITAEVAPLVTALGTLAAGQIRYDRERAESRKRGRLLTTLERVGRLMNSNLQMKLLLPTLHQTVAEELQIDSFVVMLTIPHDPGQVYMAYLFDDGKRYPSEVLPLPETGPTAEVIRSGEARRFEGVPSGAGTIGSSKEVVGMLVAPLRHESRVIGAISAQSYRATYDQDHLDFLSAVASQAAIAIENAQLYQQTEEIALTDHMTGLGNSRRFQAALGQMLEQADAEEHPLALLMIDSDSLKRVNDQHGHKAGDAHILQLARAISGNVRNGDVACRYAGDEFVVILPETPLAAAERVGERIRQAVAEGFVWDDGAHVATSVSIGVAPYLNGMTMEGLFSRADQAMYRAKQGGRNQVMVMQ